MQVRLGYVCISKKLGKKVTTSSTVTFANYSKLPSEEKKLDKLKAVAASNLTDLATTIKYNIENNIHFYRITSALIPLNTHPEVGDWGYRKFLKKDFEYVGKLVNNANMRVDTHPDEFNVINSVNPKVVENTKINLLAQALWFDDFNYPYGKMVIHVGGATGGKEAGIERFINNFKTFPKEVTSKLIIENDDKTYTAKETLYLCQQLNVPMVLDVHHHNCNNDGENIYELIPDIFKTWENEKLPPKLHFSSPKEGEKDRKHADFIHPGEFVEFIENAKRFDTDMDIMLECKEKDIALFQLVQDIKELKPEYNWIDETTFIV